MQREIIRLFSAICLAFGVMFVVTLFWMVWERDNIILRDDNPRRVLGELNIQRGDIYDQNGTLLAYTELANNIQQGGTRIYPYPQVASAIGYYSYQFGQAGVEEGFNDYLKGNGLRSISTILEDNLLNQFVVGGDVQTTLDLPTQIALHDALKEQRGAGIVVHIPSGAVRAMISAPYFDPNRIEAFQDDESTEFPLLNRVTAGNYQIGGALQTTLYGTLLSAGVEPNLEVNIEPMIIDDILLECALPIADNTTTLAIAYQFGCPSPFIELTNSNLRLSLIEDAITAAGFATNPTIEGYPVLKADADFLLDPEDWRLDAAGQGELTVTPLQMVEVISAVINDGKGVSLQFVDAVRYPSTAEWEPLTVNTNTPAIMQPSIARSIVEVLQQNNFGNEILPLYGHVSVAVSGDQRLYWFLGWIPMADDESLAIVMVLEGDTLTSEVLLNTLSEFRDNLP